MTKFTGKHDGIPYDVDLIGRTFRSFQPLTNRWSSDFYITPSGWPFSMQAPDDLAEWLPDDYWSWD